MPVLQALTLFVIFGIFILISNALSGRINKKSSLLLLITFILIYTGIYIIMPEQVREDIFSVSSVIMAITICIVIVTESLRKHALYIIFLLYGFITAVGSFISWVSYLILGELTDFVMIDFFINLFLLSFCIIATKKRTLSRILNSINQLRWFIKLLLITSFWISALIASLYSYYFHTFNDEPWFIIAGIFACMLIIIVGILCPLLVTSTLSSVHYKNLSTLMDNQVKTQVKHYEALSILNEDIRRFKHDYRNLFIGLNESLERGDTKSAITILSTKEMMSATLGSQIETGSLVLDAMLNEKQLSASKINSSIEFNGVVPGNLLSPVDICMIFGNALDNAIEACAKCQYEENKIITINSSFNNGFLFIKIENPVADEVKIVNNNITSTKPDKRLHGIGLQSIRTAVEKYSGSISLSCSNGVFCLEIDLDFNDM